MVARLQLACWNLLGWGIVRDWFEIGLDTSLAFVWFKGGVVLGIGVSERPSWYGIAADMDAVV
jgi:hypothetical protein